MLHCRSAAAWDLSSLLNLYAELSAANGDLAPILAAERLGEMLAMPQLYLGLGEIDRRVVTTATLVLVPNLTRGGRPYGIIENVVTATDMRGRGHARAMLAHLVERARAANAYKVMLMTGRKDGATLRFYDGCGFTRGTKTAFEMRF